MKKELMKYLSDEKDNGEMSEQDIMAKMDVLKELLEMASMAAGDDLKKNMQKVTVAAPDKEGLMKGMEKAEELLENEDMMGMESEDEEEMSDEMMDEEDEDEEYKRKMKGM